MQFAIKKIKLPCSFTRRNIMEIIRSVENLKSGVQIVKNDRPANMKSLLGLLSLNLCCGDDVDIICRSITDEDARNDLERVINIINSIKA